MRHSATMPTTATRRKSRWLSVADACTYAGVSRATLYRYIDDGLPSHQPAGRNGRRLFDQDEIDAWLRNRCSDRVAGHDAEQAAA